MLVSRNLHNKSSEVFIKTRSTPASLSFNGRATKHTTVKWSKYSRYNFSSYQHKSCLKLLLFLPTPSLFMMLLFTVYPMVCWKIQIIIYFNSNYNDFFYVCALKVACVLIYVIFKGEFLKQLNCLISDLRHLPLFKQLACGIVWWQSKLLLLFSKN